MRPAVTLILTGADIAENNQKEVEKGDNGPEKKNLQGRRGERKET